MQVTTTFRDMASSPALQASVDRWAARLEQACDRIAACHVSIEKPHHLQGSRFHVHIVVSSPGVSIVVSNQGNADVFVALADAFRAAQRQLTEHGSTRYARSGHAELAVAES